MFLPMELFWHYMKIKSLANTLGNESNINVYMRVSVIKTVMYTKYQDAIFDQNGFLTKTDISYLYI